MGPPSSRTVRRPSASLPRVRPRVKVSTATGRPTNHTTMISSVRVSAFALLMLGPIAEMPQTEAMSPT
ncbi:hypothetical protein GCM10025872_26620 [Barrientosiimonas endolithica]|uniref:Uncharacterized protein n=1 Tax=Barrientosiimonas endolithica TaxID=1535208 RepID=A0ABN6YNR9_9MICO|nr:hypothetical protein GCM10025872_26620 [Barrientosiimonas endolithica]